MGVELLKNVDLALQKREMEFFNHNTNLIKSFGKTAQKHFEKVLDGCYVTGKIELVDKHCGQKQDENYGMFKNIHIDQWSTDWDGDSFAGFIYANIKGQWIKIPFVF